MGHETAIKTAVGTSDLHSITVAGYDLAGDLMGNIDLSTLAFILVADRMPTRDELVLFNAALVALADHGLTPSSLSARLTYTGAPESVQGAIAAGLLGGGDVLLGVVENTARFLTEALVKAPDETDATLAALAVEEVGRVIDAGGRVPGLGHPIHREGDPRTERLYALAADRGLLGSHLRLLRHIGHAADRHTGRSLPINGAGVCGATFADLGVPWSIVRGLALLARCAGLLGHVREEQLRPLGMNVWTQVDGAADYDAPRRRLGPLR